MKHLIIAIVVAMTATLTPVTASAGVLEDKLAECRSIYGPKASVLYKRFLFKVTYMECVSPAQKAESDRKTLECIRAGGRVV